MNKDVFNLGNKIYNYIYKDFANKHLTGNLMETMNYSYNVAKNTMTINIPAQEYDMPYYIKHKIILHNSPYSYANKLNDKGSVIYYEYKGHLFKKYVGNHLGYLQNAIYNGINDVDGVIIEDDTK